MSDAPGQDDLPTGTVVEGRYVIEGLLGRGGMAAVYRVRHLGLETQHALKVLSVGGASLTRRLKQEGRVQAALQHPNIVSVTDMVSVDGGATGIVMEFVRGPSLETLLETRRPTPAQIDALAMGILDGVISAHALNLIHRDLKPANIMVAITTAGLVPKVADFGLVKLIASEEGGSFSKTRSGMAMGTPAYMAPEQIEDAKGVDMRADVWSLGAILFELVSGERAFEGANVLSLFMKVSSGTRKPIREVAPDAPQRWVDAIEGALTVDREQRIADVRTLRQRWLQGAALSTDSPWDDEWLALATSLGAKADSAKDFLERSFRSGANQVYVLPPSPVAVDPNAATKVPGSAGPTAVPASGGTTTDPDTLGEPVPSAATAATVIRPAVAPPASSATPLVAAGLGLVPLALGGLLLVGLALVAGGYWWTQAPPAPVPPPAPTTLEPVAAPAPVVPATPVPPPVATPQPGPSPLPRPGTPNPAPAPPTPPTPPTPAPPVPDTVVAPVPEPPPVPEPTPAPSVTAVRINNGGVTVKLLDDSGRPVSGAGLPPGRYSVVAFFDPKNPEKGTTFGPFSVAEGQTVQVDCIPSHFTCKVPR